MSVTVIDELVTLLGVELSPGTQAKIQKMSAGLDSITRSAKWAAAGLAGLGAGFLYFMERTTQASAEIYRMSLVTGIGTDKLQKWAWAVRQSGGDSKSALGDIQMLSKSLNVLGMPGVYNEGLFKLFGPEKLKDFKNVNDILFAVAEKFRGMSGMQQAEVSQMLGIGPDLQLLLRRGPDALRKEMARAPILSEAQLAAAHRLDITYEGIKQRFSAIGKTIATSLAPSFERVLKIFERWLLRNKEWIGLRLERVLQGIGAGIVKFGQAADHVITAIMPKFKGLVDVLSSKEGMMDITYWGLWAGAALAVLPAISKIASFFIAGGPWGLAVAAAIAAGVHLYNNWEDIETHARIRWPRITQIIKDSIIAIKEMFEGGDTPMLERFQRWLYGDKLYGFLTEGRESGGFGVNLIDLLEQALTPKGDGGGQWAVGGTVYNVSFPNFRGDREDAVFMTNTLRELVTSSSLLSPQTYR